MSLDAHGVDLAKTYEDCLIEILLCGETPVEMLEELVQPDEWVLLEQPDGFHRLVQLKPDSKIDLSKYGKIQSDELFGKPFECVFDIAKENCLKQIPEHSTPVPENSDLLPNDTIFDTNTSQRLSHEDITRLKNELEPQELVESLISNSESFQKKNAFAQVKYRKRKESKFSRWIRVKRCTIYSLCEYYFSRDAEKIGFLRIDTLSQMLCIGNVFSGQNVLVFDETRGLLIGSVASLNGTGLTIPFYTGQYFQPHLYEHFNLSDSIIFPVEASMMSNPESIPVPLENSTDKFLEKHGRLVRALKALKDKLMNSLMIVSIHKKLDLLLFEQMLGTLKPSSPVVMFAPYKEFLVDYFAMFMSDPRFVDVRLAEPWMREYQTAPGRCHPLISMSGHGGYLLSAFYVLE